MDEPEQGSLDQGDRDRNLRIRYLGFAEEGSVGDDVAYAAFRDYMARHLRVPAEVVLRRPYLAPMSRAEEEKYDFHVLGGGTCLSPLGQRWADHKVATLAEWALPFCLYGVSGVDESRRSSSVVTDRSAKMLADIAQSSLFSSVRDSEAYRLLFKYGGTKLSLDGDPTFYYVRRIYERREQPPSKRERIGIVLAEVKRAWLGVYPFDLQQVFTTMADFCRSLLREGYELELLMFNGRDADLYGEFARNLGLPAPPQRLLGLEQLADHVSGCRVIVGMRLHSAIFACACGTPFLAIAYKRSITALVRTDWDYPYHIDVQEFSMTGLEGLFRRLLEEEDRVKAKLRQISDETYRRQERALEIVATLIRNHSLASGGASPVGDIRTSARFRARMVSWKLVDWLRSGLGRLRRRLYRALGLPPPGRPR